MTNLKNLKWIGDLSLQDADILVNYARNAKNILEFGCGGSTQLFIQVCSNVTSVETHSEWIEVVNKRICNINPLYKVNFKEYTVVFEDTYDLIFVDGVIEKRLEFATEAWKYLNVDGVLIFHDTNKSWGKNLVKKFFTRYLNEIDFVLLNTLASNGKQSNMSIFKKRIHSPFVNWQKVENKPLWSYGGDKTVLDAWELK